MTSSTSTTGGTALRPPTTDRFHVKHGKGLFWSLIAAVIVAMALLATWTITRSDDTPAAVTSSVSDRISPNAADYREAQQRLAPGPVSPNAVDHREMQSRGSTSGSVRELSPSAADYREAHPESVPSALRRLTR